MDSKTHASWETAPERDALSTDQLGVEQLPSNEFSAVAVIEANLENGLRSLIRFASTIGRSLSDNVEQAALVLVRLHSHPLGLVRLNLNSPEPMREWPAAIISALGAEISDHLEGDRITPPPSFDLWFGQRDTRPLCLAERRQVLARAKPATIVIATRERPDQLARCIDSLLLLDYPEFEILVIDNNPESDTTERLVATRFPLNGKVRYFKELEQGLGAAHNRGLKEARGEVLAFTDDDVVVDRHWLSALMTPFITRPEVAGATGLIMPAELETRAQLMLESHGRFSKGFAPSYFDMGTNRPADKLFPFAVGRFGSGANMAFDANYLRRAGGFDPALGTGTPAKGGDDLAALFSLLASGQTLAYCPGAVVWHYHHREDAALERQAFGYGVGLGAYLTSVSLARPRAALSLLARLPAAATHMIRYSRSAAVADSELARVLGTSPEWPGSLVRLQRRGLVAGPTAYLASRRAHRRHRRARAIVRDQ